MSEKISIQEVLPIALELFTENEHEMRLSALSVDIKANYRDTLMKQAELFADFATTLHKKLNDEA